MRPYDIRHLVLKVAAKQIIWEMTGLNCPLGSVLPIGLTNHHKFSASPLPPPLCTWLCFVQTWPVWCDTKNFCGFPWLQNKGQILYTDFIHTQPSPHESGLLAAPNRAPLLKREPQSPTCCLHDFIQQQAFKLSTAPSACWRLWGTPIFIFP